MRISAAAAACLHLVRAAGGRGGGPSPSLGPQPIIIITTTTHAAASNLNLNSQQHLHPAHTEHHPPLHPRRIHSPRQQPAAPDPNLPAFPPTATYPPRGLDRRDNRDLGGNRIDDPCAGTGRAAAAAGKDVRVSLSGQVVVAGGGSARDPLVRRLRPLLLPHAEHGRQRDLADCARVRVQDVEFRGHDGPGPRVEAGRACGQCGC